MSPAGAKDPNYGNVLFEAEAALNESLPSESFLAVDAWLRDAADLPPSKPLSYGSGFGQLHEMLTGKRLSKSLNFTVAVTDTERAWFELLENGTFSEETLAEPAPQSFMVDRAWVSVLTHSGEAMGWTYLHHLHLHIAYRQLGEVEAANQHLNKSVSLNNKTNVLGLFLSGQGPNALAAAYDAVPATAHADSHAVDVARDVLSSLLDTARAADDERQVGHLLTSTDKLPSQVQRRLLGCQSVRLATVWNAVHGLGNPQLALKLLQEHPWAVSTGDLLKLWFDAHYLVWAQRMGRPPSALERVHVRQANTPPAALDFRGAS